MSILVGLRKLAVFGVVSTLLYLSIAVIFWTDSTFNQSPRVQLLLGAIIAVLTAIYFAGMWRVRETSVRVIVGFAAVLAIVGFAAGPYDSTDVYFYMAQGWKQTNYHENPYSSVLRDNPSSPADPMITSRWMKLNRNAWLDEPLPYGFGFALLTRGLTWLGAGNWWLTLTLFNVLNLTIHAGVAFLLWKTAALVPGADPKLILYLYAWSPLVVFQYLANLHNDIIMASLIVLAFYLLLSGRATWAPPTLVAAGLVKYVAFALAPFALIFLFRRKGWRQALLSLSACLLVSVLLSLPYIWEARSFRMDGLLAQMNESSGSLHSFITFTYRAATRFVSSNPAGIETFSTTAKVLLWIFVASFAAYQLSCAWSGRKSSPIEIASRWTSVLFAIVFVGSSQFYTWYIGILLPISLLGVRVSALTDVIILLSGTHMVFGFLRGKAIGYFILCTAIPALVVLWHRRRGGLQVLGYLKPSQAPLPKNSGD